MFFLVDRWIEMARLALHLGGLLRIRRAHEVRQMRKRIAEADNNETRVIQSHLRLATDSKSVVAEVIVILSLCRRVSPSPGRLSCAALDGKQHLTTERYRCG